MSFCPLSPSFSSELGWQMNTNCGRGLVLIRALWGKSPCICSSASLLSSSSTIYLLHRLLPSRYVTAQLCPFITSLQLSLHNFSHNSTSTLLPNCLLLPFFFFIPFDCFFPASSPPVRAFVSFHLSHSHLLSPHSWLSPGLFYLPLSLFIYLHLSI